MDGVASSRLHLIPVALAGHKQRNPPWKLTQVEPGPQASPRSHSLMSS